jgi:hypothetical protein
VTPILWIVLALLAAFAGFFVVAQRAARRLPPIVLAPGEIMPVTTLQRLARVTLAIVAVLSLTALGIVVSQGVNVWWNDDAVRLTTTAVLLAALASFTGYSARVGAWIKQDDPRIDERDRAILASAPAGQAPAILITLAVWMVALTESYQGTHLVPTPFLYLIFWSCLMVSMMALLAGVLVGYRRS